MILDWTPGWRGPIKSFSSVCRPVRLEPIFLEICSLFSPEILHIDKNLEVQKGDGRTFSCLFGLKWTKKAQNWFKMKFSWVFLIFLSLLLLEVTLNERLYNSLFPCANPISGKILLHKFRPKYSHPIRLQDSFIINIFGRYPWTSFFFSYRYSPKKSSIIWNYYPWLGMSRHAQLRPFA